MKPARIKSGAVVFAVDDDAAIRAAISSLVRSIGLSVETREHRERGIDAGANAYLVKSSFDQSDLLETVRRLI